MAARSLTLEQSQDVSLSCALENGNVDNIPASAGRVIINK